MSQFKISIPIKGLSPSIGQLAFRSRSNKIAKIYPREIKHILDNDGQNAQGTQSLSKTAQAYKLFDEGKSPMEVAVTLDLRELEVTQLYKESWRPTKGLVDVRVGEPAIMIV